MKSYALDNLDLKMRPYLPHDSGFFIECGANDGVTQSNTYAYELLGWNGLLIEPCRANYSKCLKNRPNSIVENCALVSFEYGADTIDGFFDNACYNGLMSVLDHFPGSVDQDRIPNHQDFVKKFNIQKSTVPAKTLQSLLHKYNIKSVDFFSLDVEGYELEVLGGIDFDLVRPKYILIETTESKQNKEKVNEYMRHIGYNNIDELSINDTLFKDKLL